MNRGFAGTISREKAEISLRNGAHGARGRGSALALPVRVLLILGMVTGVVTLGARGAQAQSVFSAEPVGTASGTQAVTVPVSTSGTVSSVAVLTGGAAGLDFAAGTGASTCTGSLTAGATCTAYVAFTPTAPGARTGAVVVVGTAGAATAVLGTAHLSGTGSGSLGVIVPGNMTPVAGQVDTYLGAVGDGNPATQAVPFRDALKQAGYYVRTVTVPGAPHFWSSEPIEDASSYAAFAAPRVLRFLDEKL